MADNTAVKTDQEKQAELAKKHGALRAQFIRRHALAWMEKFHSAKLKKFQDAAWEKYPVGDRTEDFETDESLLSE